MLEQEIKDILEKRDISVFKCDRERCTPGLKCIDCLAQSIAQLFEAEKAEIFREIETYRAKCPDFFAAQVETDAWWQSLKNKFLGEKK